MEAEELVNYMKENVSDIMAILGESFTVTRLLLAHFNWNKQALLER